MSPVVIPNGGGGVTASEADAYGGIVSVDNGDQRTDTIRGGSFTPELQQVVNHVEQKLDAIVSGWIDSGGPGGHQQAVSHEILRRAALLQNNVNRSVRHWAKPGRERALAEMLSVLVAAIADRDRLLLELRERLNESPY